METLTLSLLGAVQLTSLMDKTDARPEIVIGLIDGQVFLSRPDLTIGRIQEIPGSSGEPARARTVLPAFLVTKLSPYYDR